MLLQNVSIKRCLDVSAHNCAKADSHYHYGESWLYIVVTKSTALHLEPSIFQLCYMFQYIIPSHKHPFSYHWLKPFGCLAFAHDWHWTSKICPVAKRYIFVGIEPNARAWRLWDKHTQCIFVTGDAVFRENTFPAGQDPQSPSISASFRYPKIYDAISSSHTETPSQTHNHQSTTEHNDLSHTEENPDLTPTMNQTNFDPIVNQQSDVLDSPEPIRRTSRITTPPVRYGFATSTHTDSDHPTYTQAMACCHARRI